MIEHPISGPMSMVKVDGSKIKHLRESQGLTQLYLATAVQVTTDTISRWENKKYPTIKKENGVKLAEALNVTLDDLLLLDEETPQSAVSPIPEVAGDSPPIPPTTQSRPLASRRALLIFGLLLCGIFMSLIIWFFATPQGESVIFAERDLPPHSAPGQPFPVLLRVSGITEDKPATVVIKENLANGASAVKIAPDNAGGGAMKKDTVKWLKKINGPATFAYVATVTGNEKEKLVFSGTAAVSGESAAPTPITGEDTIVIAPYHWADTDKDNRISDSEILAVHDRYSEVPGIDIDIDTIEAIWLGSGYSWNPKTKSFKIRE